MWIFQIGKQAWLLEAHIAPYEQANRFNHEPRRNVRLLLHKKQIRELWNNVRIKGMTVVPTRVYLKDGRAKIEIALAKGKKAYDKRATIAKRDEARSAEREMRVIGNHMPPFIFHLRGMECSNNASFHDSGITAAVVYGEFTSRYQLAENCSTIVDLIGNTDLLNSALHPA